MFRYLLIVSLMLSLSACGTSPKTNFYVLNSDYEPPAQGDEGVSVGVLKATLPVLLDRSEIVTREGQYKIELADFHHWAGGLNDNLISLITRELSQRLKSNRIYANPQRTNKKSDYQVKVFIIRFDGELGGEVALRGAWSLLSGQGEQELGREIFVLSTQAKGTSYSDMVAALSDLAVQLSEKIANGITAQEQSKSN